MSDKPKDFIDGLEKFGKACGQLGCAITLLAIFLALMPVWLPIMWLAWQLLWM